MPDINPQDFFVESPVFGMSGPDYNRVNALPDEDLAAYYLALMTEYREEDGWWGKAGIPKCQGCREEIDSPEELRRLAGGSYHPTCFRKPVEEDDNPDRHVREFRRRIVELDKKGIILRVARSRANDSCEQSASTQSE